jgi:uncharacterized protein YbjT (DUF2867 family)
LTKTSSFKAVHYAAEKREEERLPEKPLILVTGATGAQGGSVASHLLSGGRFAVRALTRKLSSPAASALREAGADVVRADFDDPERLRQVMKGCYGAFGVTNYWEHFDGEYRQGRNLVDAVAAAGLRHFVFSSLPSVDKASGGKLRVPHFEGKARLEADARETGIPATFVHVAFYYQNFLTFFPPQKQEDGSLTFGFPQGDTPLAGVDVGDLGGVVAAIFERPGSFIGRRVGVVGDDMPPQAYADCMSRVLGRRIAYNHIPREIFAKFPFPGADDLADMFDFNRRFIPDRRADLEECRRLFPGMHSFEAWLEANKHRFASL